LPKGEAWLNGGEEEDDEEGEGSGVDGRADRVASNREDAAAETGDGGDEA